MTHLPLSPWSSWRRAALSGVLALTLLASTCPARADGEPTAPPDTVVLKDGGRLRGTVIEEDPRRGVTVQLLDGTTRKVGKSALDHVEYAPAPAPPAAPAPATAAVAPPPVTYATPEAPPPPKPPGRGLMVAGLVLMPIGAVGIIGGIAYYASASTSHTAVAGQGCDPITGCTNVYETYHDSSGQGIAAGIIVGGVVFFTVGMIMTLVGAHHRAPVPAPAA